MVPLVADKLADLERLCRENGVVRLWLFGSGVGRGSRFDELSDLDFVVELQRSRSEIRGFADPFWKIYIALEDLFRRSIHLLEPHEIHKPELRDAVERQRELLYDASRAVAAS
jgi:predicted nucleotidyltransferase